MTVWGGRTLEAYGAPSSAVRGSVAPARRPPRHLYFIVAGPKLGGGDQFPPTPGVCPGAAVRRGPSHPDAPHRDGAPGAPE